MAGAAETEGGAKGGAGKTGDGGGGAHESDEGARAAGAPIGNTIIDVDSCSENK